MTIRLVAGTFVAALAIGLLFVRSAPDSYDATIMLQVTSGMLHEHSVRVQHDQFGFNTPYSSYGIGQSLFMVPPYAVAEQRGKDPVAGAMATNGYLFASTVVLLMLLCLYGGATVKQAAIGASLIGLGTTLLPYASTGFSEMGVALSVTAGLLSLEALRAGRPWAAALAGAASGLALLMRTDSVALIVPIFAVAAYELSRRSLAGLIRFAVGFAPALFVWGLYNHVRFGAPWRLGYRGQGFTQPFFRGLYGQLLSPGKGLLIYAPILLVAIGGAGWAWQRSPAITLAAGALLGVRLLFYAKWWAWDGGMSWGPRFLVPAMPLMVLGVVEVVKRWRSLGIWIRGGIALVALASVAVQLIASAVPVEIHYRNVVTEARSRGEARPADAYVFRLQSFPILAEARLLFRGDIVAEERRLCPHRACVVHTTFTPKLKSGRLIQLTGLFLLGCIAVGSAAIGRRHAAVSGP